MGLDNGKNANKLESGNQARNVQSESQDGLRFSNGKPSAVLEPGTYPVVLAYTTSTGGVGGNLKPAGQIVAGQDDALYVAAHGHPKGMKLIQNQGIKGARDAANSIESIMASRFGLGSVGARKARWMDETGATFGNSSGAYIAKNAKPFARRSVSLTAARFRWVVLVSCQTGKGYGSGRNFAQDLSNELNTMVIAPVSNVNLGSGEHPRVRVGDTLDLMPEGEGWIWCVPGLAPRPMPKGTLPCWK